MGARVAYVRTSVPVPVFLALSRVETEAAEGRSGDCWKEPGKGGLLPLPHVNVL